ncbi:helix-turn-helix transcriptional regulator [Flavobacterium sp. TSSA_36]|uniref:helix-turn-helix transcriptional regulator n=1 Tax=Flavobacterium sp. TSSA_36 TaxID=3447669 RepID=UPI003F2FB6E4
MSKHGTIRRYTLILEKIKKSDFPTFSIIKNYLFDHGFEVGDRTIQRDIEQIRFEFGIEIMYNRDKKGYFIDYDNSLDVNSFFRFLEIVNTAELLSESLSESRDTIKFISFDSGGGLKGIENLKLLLKAVKENRQIVFDHCNFQTDKIKKHYLKPYLLKEYQNRWYVVGLSDDFKDFRSYGIDRITNLELLTENFKRDDKLDPIENFNNTIGLVYSKSTLQKIVLSFTSFQGKYINTLPFHSSQKTLIDNETEFVVSLNIIPNYELIQQILRHGETVKVIEPKWLADEIKGILKRTLKKYHDK